MDKSLHLTICVLTALLLLRESSQAGEEKDPEVLPAPKPDFILLSIINSFSFYLQNFVLISEFAFKWVIKRYSRAHLVAGTLGRWGWAGKGGEMFPGLVADGFLSPWQEADIAVAPLTVTSAREEVVSFTTPFLQTGIGILLRKDTASQDLSFFHFLSPFSKETWTALLFAYLLTCFCLFLVARLSPCEWNEPKNEENHFTFLNSLWFGAGALALQGATPRPQALSVRVIAVVWWLFTLALLAAYIANFTALLSSGSEQLPIQTFEDLVKQRNLEFGTLEGSSTFYYFKNSKNPIHQMIYEYMEKRREHVLVKTYQEAVQRVMDSNYAFIGESISQDLAAARHCNLIRAPEVIGARGFGIATTQASPWTKPLSIAVLKLRESGDLDYLRNKWWESSCLRQSRERWGPLEPPALGGLFLTLGIGLALGILAALAELSSSSRRRAAHAKKSCCSVFTEEICTRLRIKGAARQSQETSGKANA
ncbi:GLRK protein, partial [Setophaga kirtlandii]|nr:GLRK protein [Setophaga kirtlandii]